MSFFGDGFDGLCCGGVCNTPPEPASFLGGWWGATVWNGGAYLTRLPSFLTNADWLEIDDLGRYVWRVYHENASVAAPDIVEGGTTYRCVGVAGSQCGDGSWFAPAMRSVVWYQLHYAPLSDLKTTTPRAALACVQTADHSAGTQQTAPSNSQATLLGCWLVNDENGSPEQWNSDEKLCHFFENDRGGSGVQYKTLCGPSHFAFQRRRLSSGTQDKIIYYGIDQATPTVVTWDNVEGGTGTTWKPLFFSAASFPWALWSRCYNVEYYGSGTLKRLGREYRITKAALPALTPDNANPCMNKRSHDALWTGEDAGSGADITVADTALYVIDCDFGGQHAASVTPNPSNPTFVLHLDVGPADYDAAAPWLNGANADAATSAAGIDLEGTDYRVGATFIGVARSDGLALGFDRTTGSPTKPDWEFFTSHTAGSGEIAGATSLFGSGPVTGDPWLASGRTCYRIFARRHNSWFFDESYFQANVGTFVGTTFTGVSGSPNGPLFSAGNLTPGESTVVQSVDPNFYTRPSPPESSFATRLGVVTGLTMGLTPGDNAVNGGVYLDYTGNDPSGDPNDPPVTTTAWNESAGVDDDGLSRLADAWFWNGGEQVPLYRPGPDGLLASRVYAGWYYIDTESGPAVRQSGLLGYDPSRDGLHETWDW